MTSKCGGLLLCLLGLALGVVAQPVGDTPAAGGASVAQWRAAVTQLHEIDQLVGAGKTAAATTTLGELQESWPPPLDHLAESYLEKLKANVPDKAKAIGVELLANAIGDINNAELRPDLEDRILGLEPPAPEAAVAVLVGRGVRAYQERHFDTALRFFVTAREKFPGTESDGLLLFNEGVALRDLERYPEAIDAFTRLIHMKVNNREMYASSIMDMGYQNYHYRAARNLSWCYERMGKLDRAYEWVRLARTTYPYQGWCGVELTGARLSLGRATDRLAWKIGGWTAISHFGSGALRLWYAWGALLLLGAALLSPGRRLAIASAKGIALVVVVGLGLGIAVPVLNPDFTDSLSYWFGRTWPVRLAVPVILFLTALAFLKWRPKAAKWLVVAALFTAAAGQSLWYLSMSVPFGRLPVFEKQVGFFAVVAPTAVLVAGCVLALVVALKRKPCSGSGGHDERQGS